MRKVIFSLAFMLIGSFAFANTQSFEKQKNVKIENGSNHLKVIFDLGNLSNLSETDLISLLDNLPTQIVNSDQFSECTISYSVTVTILGQSVTLTASGTAATCEQAGSIARAGIRSEYNNAVKLIKSITAN